MGCALFLLFSPQQQGFGASAQIGIIDLRFLLRFLMNAPASATLEVSGLVEQTQIETMATLMRLLARFVSWQPVHSHANRNCPNCQVLNITEPKPGINYVLTRARRRAILAPPCSSCAKVSSQDAQVKIVRNLDMKELDQARTWQWMHMDAYGCHGCHGLNPLLQAQRLIQFGRDDVDTSCLSPLRRREKGAQRRACDRVLLRAFGKGSLDMAGQNEATRGPQILVHAATCRGKQSLSLSQGLDGQQILGGNLA